MKTIEIDDDLYTFIAAQTKHIGESASDILRRLLMPESPRPLTTDNEPATHKEIVSDLSEENEDTYPQPVNSTLAPQADDKAILAHISESAINNYTKRVDQFLFVLSQLYRQDPEAFATVEQIKGKNRTYFATSKEQLLENGSSTNPKAIPDSPYWVVTNNNTAKKIAMLEQVLHVLGYSEPTVRTVIGRFAPETETNG